MGNTSRGVLARVLVHSGLKLLQELIDVQQIALRPQIRQRKGVRVMHRRVLCLGNHSATMAAVLGHAATLVTAAEHWKLNSLKTHEALTNIVVSRWVNRAALSIAKKLVESVVCCTLTDFIVIVQLLRLIDGIVDRTIGGVLRWTSVESSWSTARVLLTIASIGAKSAIRILVATRCSGERLQVSDNCSAPVRKRKKN